MARAPFVLRKRRVRGSHDSLMSGFSGARGLMRLIASAARNCLVLCASSRGERDLSFFALQEEAYDRRQVSAGVFAEAQASTGAGARCGGLGAAGAERCRGAG